MTPRAMQHQAKLNILVATHRYPPYVAGGYELRTSDVVKGLRERGHRVSVLTGRGSRFEGTDADVLPRLSPSLDDAEDFFVVSDGASNAERIRLHFFRLANWSATLQALEATGAELLLFHNLSMVSLAPVLAARHAGVRTLGDVSDPWPENHWVRAWRENHERDVAAGGRGKGLRLASIEAAWRTFRGLVDLGPLLVPSHFLRQRFVEDGLPADSIEVLPTALSPDSFASAEAVDSDAHARPPERRLGDPNRPLRVFCTSALWPGKGVHVLVDAAQRCTRSGIAIDLRLAGDGDPNYIAELRARASEPELNGRVHLLGRVGRDVVARELDACDVFAFPSLWGEPYARAPMEAMLRGIPVIASDAGATPELVRHDRDGWIVPAGDADRLARALGRLAADSELRERLARGGRERVHEACDFGHYLDGVEAACLRAARGVAALEGAA